MPNPGSFGLGEFGSSYYGSGFNPFGVISAASLSTTLVRLSFSDPVDFTDPAVLSPLNYTVVPSLTVYAVSIETSSSVRLVTSSHDFIVYEATVTTARSLDNRLISPLLNRAFFTGTPSFASYFAVGMSPTRVRLIFSTPMSMDAALSDPSSYTVQSIGGVSLPITAVVVEQAVHPTSIILTLGDSMQSSQWYETTIVGPVQTESLTTPLPAESLFQFIRPDTALAVAFQDFSGEVRGGLFGNPDGLVFFSPALQASLPNSVIQVDDVSVCTRAYDEYHPPTPPDPFPLYTWGPSGPQTTLGQNGVTLWAPFPRLSEARLDLAFSPPDAMPAATDGDCTATFNEPWDHNYVALLNNSAWKLFDNSGPGSPPRFICANNLGPGPIPPGPTTTIILQ